MPLVDDVLDDFGVKKLGKILFYEGNPLLGSFGSHGEYIFNKGGIVVAVVSTAQTFVFS